MASFFQKIKSIMIGGAALLSALALAPTTATAQHWPDKAVTIIVPAAPGGTTDIVARLLAEQLQNDLGQTFIVENRAGAAGIIGSQQLARAKADGYTLIMGNIGPNAINYSMYDDLPYTRDDFAPISMVLAVPNVLVVNKNTEVNNVQELIELLQAEPDAHAFGSSGFGQSPHLSAELFLLRTDTEAIHVPFKGAGPATTALLGQQFLFMIDNLPSSIAHIQSGDFKALAVTSNERLEQLPDVPTLTEEGIEMSVTAWFGLLAPQGTPEAIINRLSQSVQTAMQNDEFKEKIKAVGGIDVQEWTTPESFEAFINDQIDLWAETIDAAGIERS